MYEGIDVLPKLEQEAIDFIMNNDRMMYKLFFEEIERFCASKPVLFGGRVGIDLLVGRDVNPQSFFWELYCDDTFALAKELSVLLSQLNSPHIPAKTIALQTNIRHKEFTIYVNARMLLKMYSLGCYRGVKIIDLMSSISRESLFTKVPILCIPEEIQLISIYRNLYSPSKVSMWQTEIQNEIKLYSFVNNTTINTTAKGSFDGGVDNYKGNNKPNKPQFILLDVVKKSSNVLIGDHAMKKLGLIDKAMRVQMISDMDIEDIQKEIVRRTNSTISFVSYNLNILDDFQITKHTLYLNDGKNQIAIGDIFNSSQFEMIPYSSHESIKIANLWVLLRFLFIDIWSLKIISKMGNSDKTQINNKIQENLSRCSLIRDKIYKNPIEHFQVSNYVGNFIDDTIAKKKLIKELGERFPIFYPAKQTN